MGKAFILVVQELKILFKDRQALGLLFIMPLTLIIFLTLALRDVYLAKVGYRAKLLVVVGQNCDKPKSICTQILDQFRKFDYDISVSGQTPNTLRDPVTLIFPEDVEKTTKRLKAGENLEEKDKIQLIFDPTLDQSFRALVEGNLLASLQSVFIEQIHSELANLKKKAGINLGKIPDLGHFKGLVLEKAWGGVVLPNPIQQMVPAWALFGMFFIVIPLSNSVIRDRRLGVFKRLLSFPVRRGHLIIGKILPFLLINIIQFALMFSVGVFILPKLTNLNLPLDFNFLGIAVVTLVCALASTSYGLMISSLCKTSEQASAFGSLSVVILAVLGGVMIPRFVMPDFMQQLSALSPLYWGLDAYQDLIVRKTSLAIIEKKILVLLGFSGVCLLISRLKFRWSEES